MLHNHKPMFLIILICFTSLISSSIFGQNLDSNDTNYLIKERLNVPFGTLVKLRIKIVNGEELDLVYYSGKYVIKILEVDTCKLENPIIMEFEDKTDKLPTNEFDLYKMLNGKEIKGGLSSDIISKMNQEYVGKEYFVVAYESGKFIGTPNKSDYIIQHLPFYMKIVAPDYFHFKNYIIISYIIEEIK
jgi:hypothetical protein